MHYSYMLAFIGILPELGLKVFALSSSIGEQCSAPENSSFGLRSQHNPERGAYFDERDATPPDVSRN